MNDLISVIVSTYNREDALDVVLRALSRQTDRNFEIVVADDGSGPATARVVRDWAAKKIIPIKHVWHEDRGFRLSEIRNRGIRASAGAYIIFLDGDCIARRDFIAAHRRLAEPGWFVTGTRILLSADLTDRILHQGLEPELWGFASWLVHRSRRHLNRFAPLLELRLGVMRKLSARRWRGARGSNMAFWRTDLGRVDGFDSTFNGWGREDSDIFIRLIRAGVRRKDGRFASGVLHLWHPEADRFHLAENDRQLDEVLHSPRIKARRGLSFAGEKAEAGERIRRRQTMTATNAAGSPGDFRRVKLPRLADALAAAAAASLPWSTSATGILVGLWLVASLPTLDIAALRQEILSVPGGLPMLLVALALAGLAWSEAPLPELARGIEPFLRLLMIPVLFAQFRRSERGLWVGAAFLASGMVLLALAWTMFWMHSNFGHGPGVPVKDYITQSGVFTLCAFALIHIAVDRWIERRHVPAVVAGGLALLFIANIVYVSTSRTTLVVIVALLLVFALQRASWQALAGAILAGVVVAGTVWATSPYVRARVTSVAGEIAEAETRETSSGSRLGFWKNSLIALREAPIFGHGTGMIGEAFRRHLEPSSGPPAVNPHNQIFTIGIQFGAVGIVALIAMWAAHWSMFLRPGIAAWAGLMAVTQNIVGSLFNSHLMDFTQTWIYVFAVGVFGGVVLRRRGAAKPDDGTRLPPSPSR